MNKTLVNVQPIHPVKPAKPAGSCYRRCRGRSTSLSPWFAVSIFDQASHHCCHHCDHLHRRLHCAFILALRAAANLLVINLLLITFLLFLSFPLLCSYIVVLQAPLQSCPIPISLFATFSPPLFSSLTHSLSQPNLLRQMVAHPETGSALRLPPILKGSFSATNEAERVHTGVCANCQKASQSRKKKEKKFCPFSTRHSVDWGSGDIFQPM